MSSLLQMEIVLILDGTVEAINFCAATSEEKQIFTHLGMEILLISDGAAEAINF